MPRVSKTRKIPAKKKKRFLNDFYAAITSLTDKDEVWAFFEDLLTYEEKLMLAKRFQIAMMLVLEYGWKEIKDYAKVTEYAIGATMEKIQTKRKGLKRIAERILVLKREKLERLEKGRKRKSFGDEILLKSTLGAVIRKAKKIRKSHSVVS